MENLNDLTPEMKAILVKHLQEKKAKRKAYRRELFKFVGYFKKRFNQKTPVNQSTLQACGTPSGSCSGRCGNNSPLHRRVGAVIDLKVPSGGQAHPDQVCTCVRRGSTGRPEPYTQKKELGP
jgi:hypothetical protein